MRVLLPFAAGLVFAAGLGLAGMLQVDKVVHFLDLTRWDPSLALVMVSAIGVHLLAYRWVDAHDTPWFDTQFHLPSRSDLDLPLVSGAAVFGIGWGISGFCPGPGLVSMAALRPSGLVFVGGLVVGMLAHNAWASTAQASVSDLPPTR